MNAEYAATKFEHACRTAIASTEPLQQRIETFMNNLGILDRDNFPDDDSWTSFDALRNTITKTTTRTTQRSFSKLSDQDASQWLQNAFDLCTELAEVVGEEFKAVGTR